jgi:protein SSD1
LRRYSDLVVHRQLKLALQRESGEAFELKDDIESLKMTSEYCNFKKDCAKNAQNQSIHLILCETINEMSENVGQLIVYAKILQVYESSFDVFIPEFGIEKRVHGDQLPLKKCEFDKKEGLLELYWEEGVDSATFIPEDERNKLSYRNSIKNQFKVGANEIARVLSERKKKKSNTVLSEELSNELSRLKLTPPSVDNENNELNEFFKDLKLRKEGDGNYIQEIRELETLPILLRAEIGMALPCLTVHALNPFINER